MRTQVGIVGRRARRPHAGALLHQAGIDCVVLEARSREYVEQRVRAGLLEQNTVDLLHALGVGDRLDREGLDHTRRLPALRQGRTFARRHAELTGRKITIYGQQEIVKDLIAARLERRRRRCASRSPTSRSTTSSSERPRITFAHDGARARARVRLHRRLRRLPRRSAAPRSPTASLTEHELAYPFGWLGILAEARAHHRRADLRLARARLRAVLDALAHGQPAVPAGPGRTSDIDDWPDERIWDELQRASPRRLASTRARSSTRASRRCAASSASRCSTAACSSPATPPTSSRRPAPRASTSRSTTSACSRAALRAVLRRRLHGARSTATPAPRCAASGARRTSPTT